MQLLPPEKIFLQKISKPDLDFFKHIVRLQPFLLKKQDVIEKKIIPKMSRRN